MRARALAIVLPLGLVLSGCAAEEAPAAPGDASSDAVVLDALDGPEVASPDAPRADNTPADTLRTDRPVAPDAPPPSDVPFANDATFGPPDAPPPVLPTAILEVQALDLWAQPIPVAERTFSVRRAGVDAPTTEGSSFWVRSLDLTTASTYEVSLDAPDHRPLTVAISFDGTPSATGLTARATTPGHGLALSHTTRTVGGRSVAVHTLSLGLRHQWFSAQGRPARRGNNLHLLMDGDEAWASVNTELRAARTTVHMATWWWQSTFELVRDPRTHTTQTLTERQQNTILSILEASPARKRVLVGQFLSMDGTFSDLSTDAGLRAHGTLAGDNFEHMGQANPTRGSFHFEVPTFRFGDRVRAEVPGASGVTFDPEVPVASEVAPRDVNTADYPTMLNIDLASYHQKFAVIDQRVAFIGGMNLRAVDWDTSQHLVFDARRMNLTSSNSARASVVAHDSLPDTGPRKDYMVRIEGPIVRDAEDIFHRRWRYLLDTRARYSSDASDFTVSAPPAPVDGGVSAQVTATLPSPFNEYAIAETWINAVQNARSYIYIEDQYFRIPMLTDIIQRRMDEVPGLRLIVITKPVNEYTDPGCAWTYRTHAQFSGRYPGRYMLLQLRSFDTEINFGIDETDARFINMDTHAKILIVDDMFLSVGSCNKNNRGIEYEGELNVAVFDRTWVRAARRRIFANLLQTTAVIPDDVALWWSMLARATSLNDAVRALWTAEGDDLNLNGAPLPEVYRPRGFLYTLVFGPSRDCLLESIGPDVV